jgi:diguanylate cyclase
MAERDAVSGCAMRAGARMAALGIPPTPENYWVWYTVESGQLPDLTRAAAQLAARPTGVTAEASHLLYEQFSGGLREQQALKTAADGLQATMAELSGMIGETQASAQGFGTQLTGASGELDKARSGEAIASVIARLLSETRSVLAKTQEIERRLSAASTRVSGLDQELDTARREARTDGLTGLGNRREFDERLREAMQEATQSKTPLTLLMIDLDHFKKFNDTRGHVVGDQLLRHVGRTIARNMRDGSTAARYGGEEFAVILPGLNLQEANGVAERLRATFDLNPLVRRDTNEEIGRVTISAGIAKFLPGEFAINFVSRADRALYAAKHAGRNRVVLETALAEAKLVR